MSATVSMFVSDVDEVFVVQVDTFPDGGRLRINLNDGAVWDGDPEVAPEIPPAVREQVIAEFIAEQGLRPTRRLASCRTHLDSHCWTCGDREWQEQLVGSWRRAEVQGRLPVGGA